MKLQFLSILAVGALLSACCCDTPECPQPVAVGPALDACSPAAFVAQAGDRVYFAFDKSDLTSEAQATLNKQAAWLQKNPQYNPVNIYGHCDERGTHEYNKGLGMRRAHAVCKYLVGAGIPQSRVTAYTMGKEYPIPGQAGQSVEQVWQLNRVAITHLAGGGCAGTSPGAPSGVPQCGVPQVGGSSVSGEASGAPSDEMPAM